MRRPKKVRPVFSNGIHSTLFARRVYRVVAKIPRGQTLSYKEVARRAGRPKAYRAVGNILNKNPYAKDKVPCHRVIRSDGKIGGYAGGTKKKKSLLRKEGAPFS